MTNEALEADVFLYELALELDLRSVDLVAVADGLGLIGLGPSSRLAPAEVAALRSALGRSTPVDTPAPDAAPAVGPPAPEPAKRSGPRAAGAPVILPRAKSRYGRRMERRVLIGSVTIIVIVVVTFGRMIFGGGDQPADGPVTGGGGADYEGSRVVYGTIDGADAVIQDLNTFCSGRATVVDFVDGARTRSTSPIDQAELETWVIEGAAQARKGAYLIQSSYRGVGHSDQSEALYDLFDGLGPSVDAETIAGFDDPAGPVALLEASDTSRC